MSCGAISSADGVFTAIEGLRRFVRRAELEFDVLEKEGFEKRAGRMPSPRSARRSSPDLESALTLESAMGKNQWNRSMAQESGLGGIDNTHARRYGARWSAGDGLVTRCTSVSYLRLEARDWSVRERVADAPGVRPGIKRACGPALPAEGRAARARGQSRQATEPVKRAGAVFESDVIA